jgi:hypothetical protein
MRDAGSSCFPIQVLVRFHFSAGHKKRRRMYVLDRTAAQTGLTSSWVPTTHETGRLCQPQATSLLRCFVSLRVSRQPGVATAPIARSVSSRAREGSRT